MNTISIDQSSDQGLVREISKGNELAFAHFYNRHWDSLFISAYKVLKDEETCKDIVQEVFLSIWGSSNLVDVENIIAYIHQSVKYKVLMTLRKIKISEKHLETIHELAENTTENQLEFEELNKAVEQSIQSLPDKCREVFRLSRVENLPNREIAERLNISVRTVETHISHALRRLKSELDPSVVSFFILFLIK